MRLINLLIASLSSRVLARFGNAPTTGVGYSHLVLLILIHFIYFPTCIWKLWTNRRLMSHCWSHRDGDCEDAWNFNLLYCPIKVRNDIRILTDLQRKKFLEHWRIAFKYNYNVITTGYIAGVLSYLHEVHNVLVGFYRKSSPVVCRQWQVLKYFTLFYVYISN